MQHRPSPTTKGAMWVGTVSTALSRLPSTKAKLRLQAPASSLKDSSPSTTRPSSQPKEMRGKTFPFIQTTRQRRASTATCSKVQPGSSSNKLCHLSRTRTGSRLDRREVLASRISSLVQRPSSLPDLNNAISQAEDSVIWAPEGK